MNSFHRCTPTSRHVLAMSIVCGLTFTPMASLAALPPLNAVAVDEIQVSPVGRYIVTFEESGLTEYRGEVPGLERTAPVDYPLATRKLDVESAASRNYVDWLAARRVEHLTRIEQVLGRAVDVPFLYEVTRHGVSMVLSEDEANQVARLPGVRAVSPVRMHEASTYRSPSFVGANTLWDGSRVPVGANGTRGQGITIGVIDTGVDGAHPSFAVDTACGFGVDAPKLVARDCSANNGVSCTGVNPAPEAGRGHGMHVASTAAGNLLDGSVVPAPLLPVEGAISGVAPCAAVISYKACVAEGCYSDALEAAVQNAVADQVDVINYSIGPACGGGNPWTDTPNFLQVAAVDVFIAAAAGNTGSGCTDPTGLVSNLSPWVTTVAATTSDFLISTELRVTGAPPPALAAGVALVSGSTTLPAAQTQAWLSAPLRLAPGDLLGCGESVPAGYFNGAIALIRRGTCSFAEKIVNAANAGAGLVVIANNVETPFAMVTDGAPEDIAAFSVSDLAASEALVEYTGRDFSQSGTADGLFLSGFEPLPPALVDYDPAVEKQTQGDVLAGFSLRGPTASPFQNLPKPDIAAPGVSVYAAVDVASHDYGWMSGTSMASPHVAGAAVLLRAIHPEWLVDEVESALTTTAMPIGTKEDGVTTWNADDVGSGRLDLSKAALAGLTMVETQTNYVAANPSIGAIAIEDLNLPSMRNMKCGERCQWTRTFRSRLADTAYWTLSSEDPSGYALSFEPESFTLGPDQTQSVVITATINDVTLPAELSYGRIWLTEVNELSPEQQLPVAVQGDAASVACAVGYCNFRIDNFTAGYSAIGCEPQPGCRFLWANRFSPPGDAWPITLTSITFMTGSSSYVSVGDEFDFYVYQDDDRDPTNGALLVGSQKGYTIAVGGARLRTVALTTPIILNGPGDVVIALSSPFGTGVRPATGEVSEFRGRSYVGSYVGEDPDLGSAEVGLMLNPDAIGGEVNWVIRASGTSAEGSNLELGEIELLVE